MSIYKVHIATNGDTTTYTTNGTVLAEIRKIGEDYNVYQDGKLIGCCCEYDNAKTWAEKNVTSLMASVGVSPKFINE